MFESYSAYIIILFSFYSSLLLLSLYIRGFVFFEWIVSFLHYILPINILLLLGLHLWSPTPIPFYFLLISTTPIFVRLIRFILIKPVSGKGSQDLRVVSFNKLFYNKDYLEIDKAIKNLDPQILGIVEILNEDVKKIPALASYPYKYIKASRKNAYIALFSKYKFTIQDIPQPQHLITAKMDIKGKEFLVHVFHPDPPITQGKTLSRDKDIQSLASHMRSIEKKDSILMGDFNITPWSPVYIRYLSTIPHIKNTAQGQGFLTTFKEWSLQVHIDHIFVSKTIAIKSFQAQYVKGSDHKLIWTDLQI